MFEDITCIPVRRMTARTVGNDEGVLHLVGLETESDHSFTFAIDNAEFSKFIIRAQQMLTAGIEYSFNE